MDSVHGLVYCFRIIPYTLTPSEVVMKVSGKCILHVCCKSFMVFSICDLQLSSTLHGLSWGRDSHFS